MQLTIDASSLVAEALRGRGRQLIANPIFDLVIADTTMGEAEHELERRISALAQRRSLISEEANALRVKVRQMISVDLSVIALAGYAQYVSEARWRIPRDPDDVPTVALALALDCGIWTADRDFFGCGLPVWTTDTLLAYLSHHAALTRR